MKTFRDPTRARENLERLRPLLGRIAERSLLSLLDQLPDPDASLNLLERFFGVAPQEVRDYLGAHGAALHYLLAVFSYSGFLSETLLREPDLIIRLHGDPALYRVRSREEMLAALRDSGASPAHWKRQEYLRIMLRDVLELATLSEVTMELSALADALLEATLQQTHAELRVRYGAPASVFTILSLGKLGGNELNYSSDIDLLFLYRSAGETPGGITHKEYFIQLAGQITGLITAPQPEGRIFRVDLRLRPQGREGEAAHSLSAALDYYRHRARDWERQALVKARHSAGDAGLAREFLREVQPLIYRGDGQALDSVLAARQGMSDKLHRHRSRALDVKLGRGGIRDIEFLAQCLQRLHGAQDPWLRSGATLFALQRLADKGWLSSRDQGALSRAYHFLRVVEHRLQLERDQQTHRLPENAEHLDLLARRAGILKPRGEAGPALLAELGRHMQQVTSIYERVILGARGSSIAATNEGPVFTLQPPLPPGQQDYSEVLRGLESSRPALYAAVNALAPQRGGKHLQQFLTRAAAHPEALDLLAAEPELLESAATLLEESPHLGELLVHSPDDVEALRGATVATPPASLPLTAEPVREVAADPVLEHIAAGAAPLTEKMAALRREYRRRLLRVQARSVLAATPLFDTLHATSALAEQVIRASLQAALGDQPELPPGAFTVVALGRLGIREFDLASDADLAFFFTLSEPDPEAKVAWIHVAERLLSVLSAHTGEGTMFSVDTRLRPRGREGELVDSAAAVENYFQTRAEPWEAITYMKAKALAGDRECGTELLTRVQNRIGSRFGSGADAARQLADMRKRLESTTTPHNFLKTAPGGYYDIDFLLTYLRLCAAGVFYPSLNTLERLEVVERMGQITAAQAGTLREGAVVLRAVQHALRVISGRSDTELPTGGPAAAHLARLAVRWFPESLRKRPLLETIEKVMARVRRVFLEVFSSTQSA